MVYNYNNVGRGGLGGNRIVLRNSVGDDWGGWVPKQRVVRRD